MTTKGSRSVPPPSRKSGRPPPVRFLTEPPPTMKSLPRLGEDHFDEVDGASRTSQTALRVSPGVGLKHAVLTVLTGLSAGQIFSLEKGKTIIGRSHDCQLRLHDPGISRHHCRVNKTADGTFVVEDLESTNGMFVDGKRVPRASLIGGARVQIGSDVVVRFGYTDETEEALAKRLYESSTRDPLTNAFTRKYFDERMDAEIAYARRHKSPLGLILFDIDHFKVINDTHGHPAGDKVLRGIANRAIHMVRTEDVFARYGGEEFVVLARGIKPKGMVQFAERIRKGLGRTQVRFRERSLEVTVSAGVASLSELEESAGAEELIALADTRVYQAKVAGRDRVCG